jgi:hypothetical protein
VRHEQRSSRCGKKLRLLRNAFDAASLFGAFRPSLRDDAEQLVLELLRARIRTIDRYKGRFGPTHMAVDCARKHLASRAAFSVEQNRAPAGRNARQQLHDLSHRGRAAEHAVRGHLRAFRRAIVRQLGEVLCIRNDRAQVPRHERPLQHVEHARPKCIERRLGPGWIDNANQYGLRTISAYCTRNPQRVCTARAVEQTDRRRSFGELRERLTDAGRGSHGESEPGENFLDCGALASAPADPEDRRAKCGRAHRTW